MKFRKIGIITSGGDAPGMNAAIKSIVKTAEYFSIECVGIHCGYQGLIENYISKLNILKIQDISNRGGTILKTKRTNCFKSKDLRKIAYKNCIKNKIDGLIIIGGDGSLLGANIFSNEYNLPVIFIPATIDNDIPCSDFSIGYDTALNNIINSIDKIKDTAASHDRLFFIEVMGNNSSFIALNAALSTDALFVFIKTNIDNDIKRLFNIIKNNNSKFNIKSGIIIIAENVKKYINKIINITKLEFPSYDIKTCVLGHIQRGGTPTQFDRILAYKFGNIAVEKIINNNNKLVTVLKNNTIITLPFLKVINSNKKNIDVNTKKIFKIMTSI